jgi:predicted nucleic acid-binding protein
MIVVDTNVLAYRFIEGEKTEQAIAARQNDSDWIVPLLWRHEFLNVLSTSIRCEMLTLEQCKAIWGNAVRVLRGAERPVEMMKALSLSIDTAISTYDAQYIELAQSFGVWCITEDKKLLKAFPGIAVSLDEFSRHSSFL